MESHSEELSGPPVEHANATNLFLLRTGSVFLRKTTFSGVSADLLPKAIFCVLKLHSALQEVYP